jgi:hypothetical protein
MTISHCDIKLLKKYVTYLGLETIGAPGVSFEFTWMGPLNVDGFGGVQSAFGSCTPTQYRQDTSLAMPPTVHIDCRGGAPLAEVPAGSTLTYIITLVATNPVT